MFESCTFKYQVILANDTKTEIIINPNLPNTSK